MNTLIVRLLQPLLPRRIWYRKLYLRSKHWKDVRKKKLEQVSYKCAKCQRRKRWLDVHHKTYERLFGERTSDLEVLCRYHHNLEHAKQ